LPQLAFQLNLLSRVLRMLHLPKRGALPSPVTLGVTKMVKSEKMRRTSGMWMMASGIWSGPAGPLPPSLVFGESKVTTNMIREYEAAGFFPSGTGRAPLDEQIPAPEDGEVVVFRDFFTCGLRFPCDPILPAILNAFSVKIHQLSPTSFLEVSKFIWIMKTFGRNLSVDAFARFFELVIVPDVIKVDDGQYYEAQHACCTFNTRRQNTRKGITRIQIALCCKTNLTDD
jgi:hypothetical protein